METTQMPQVPETPQMKIKRDWGVPLAIIIAGALIAGAIFWTRTDSQKGSVQDELGVQNKIVEEAIKIKSDDHIRGDKKAVVKVIEYSDLECPFCKEFHQVMGRVFKENEDKIVWVYRHFPIKDIHPKAVTEAIASECVAEMGGSDKFWQFIEKFFEITPSNNQTDLSILPEIAGDLGLSKSAFNTCLSSGKFAERVEEQFKEAQGTGGGGTPWVLVVTKSGGVIPISGVSKYGPEDTYLMVKEVINTALVQ